MMDPAMKIAAQAHPMAAVFSQSITLRRGETK
jgi:hypothetical protein